MIVAGRWCGKARRRAVTFLPATTCRAGDRKAFACNVLPRVQAQTLREATPSVQACPIFSKWVNEPSSDTTGIGGEFRLNWRKNCHPGRSKGRASPDWMSYPRPDAHSAARFRSPFSLSRLNRDQSKYRLPSPLQYIAARRRRTAFCSFAESSACWCDSLFHEEIWPARRGRGIGC